MAISAAVDMLRALEANGIISLETKTKSGGYLSSEYYEVDLTEKGRKSRAWDAQKGFCIGHREVAETCQRRPTISEVRSRKSYHFSAIRDVRGYSMRLSLCDRLKPPATNLSPSLRLLRQRHFQTERIAPRISRREISVAMKAVHDAAIRFR